MDVSTWSQMSLYAPPWQENVEPNQSNIRQWMENIQTKVNPLEQARWNQSNIDTLFHAGCQSYINRMFNFSPNTSSQQYFFNIIQQPCNMITGYQRQHRKGPNFLACEGADSNTTDQYTRLMIHTANSSGFHEQYSKSCELSTIAGMNLIQPYLDYTSDQAQGDLKLKIWEYNSFLIDPYFRNPDLSDCQFIWCQEYINKREAKARFKNADVESIAPMTASPQSYGTFYFLPENQNTIRNDLLIVSYIWYRWNRKKKRLYSRKRNQFFDIAKSANLDAILYNIPDMEEVTVEVPTWKLCTVLNDRVMYQGDNPLSIDCAPMSLSYWNYDPHINYADLRNRSLVRTMRDPQFLFNYKIITNNDIAAATINSGWKRKSGAVANEDNLKKAQAGYDIIINESYDMTDVEKIVPTAVPESDMALAQQMQDLIYTTSGIKLENWSGQDDKQISSWTMMLKQAANLMVFQKYFDQWDFTLKQTYDTSLQILLNNWNEHKVELILGEEPSPHFYSKIFSKYQIIVEEGLYTPTQQSFQAQQMMDINAAYGREVFPPSKVVPKLAIQGKAELGQYLEQQEQQQSEAQQKIQGMQEAMEQGKLQELMSKVALNLASAQERYGRKDSNIGLFEERLSEISRNRALATRDKMDALTKLLDAIGKYGEIQSYMNLNQIQSFDYDQIQQEDREKQDAKLTSFANDFKMNIMGNQQQAQQPQMAIGQ